MERRWIPNLIVPGAEAPVSIQPPLRGEEMSTEPSNQRFPRTKSQEPRAKNQEPRTKNQEPGTKNFLHSSFFILHSSFFILHSSFSILHSQFFILHSSFSILHSTGWQARAHSSVWRSYTFCQAFERERFQDRQVIFSSGVQRVISQSATLTRCERWMVSR